MEEKFLKTKKKEEDYMYRFIPFFLYYSFKSS